MPLWALVFLMFAYNTFGEYFSTLSARGGLFLACPEMTAKASQLSYPVTPTRFVRALHQEHIDPLGDTNVSEGRYVPRRTERAFTVRVELLLQTVAAVVTATALGLIRISQ